MRFTVLFVVSLPSDNTSRQRTRRHLSRPTAFPLPLSNGTRNARGLSLPFGSLPSAHLTLFTPITALLPPPPLLNPLLSLPSRSLSRSPLANPLHLPLWLVPLRSPGPARLRHLLDCRRGLLSPPPFSGTVRSCGAGVCSGQGRAEKAAEGGGEGFTEGCGCYYG